MSYRMLSLAGPLVAAALAYPAHAQSPVQRGKYLVTIMDCSGCHTTGALVGKPDPAKALAGDTIGWLVPGQGVFYPANLTPDRDTGLGKWTAAEIATALRTGAEPSGRILSDVMPWRSYANLTDSDLQAVAAYLKSVPSVPHAIPPPTPLAQVTTPYLTMVNPGAKP